MLDRETHKSVMLQILKRFYTDPALGPVLGFKGGTAAMLFYGLDRFSVDLDFDLLDAENEQDVYERICAIASEFGVLRDHYLKYHTIFCMLSYDDEAQNIKIEISRRSLLAEYEMKTHLGVAMLVMAQEDMHANKLLALTDRKRPVNRDIYDVWFFLKNRWPLNGAIVKERLGINLDAYLQKCISHIEKIPDKGILFGLGELLTEKQKMWVRTHLKEETLFLLKIKHEAVKNEAKQF